MAAAAGVSGLTMHRIVSCGVVRQRGIRAADGSERVGAQCRGRNRELSCSPPLLRATLTDLWCSDSDGAAKNMLPLSLSTHSGKVLRHSFKGEFW